MAPRMGTRGAARASGTAGDERALAHADRAARPQSSADGAQPLFPRVARDILLLVLAHARDPSPAVSRPRRPGARIGHRARDDRRMISQPGDRMGRRGRRSERVVALLVALFLVLPSASACDPCVGLASCTVSNGYLAATGRIV